MLDLVARRDVCSRADKKVIECEQSLPIAEARLGLAGRSVDLGDVACVSASLPLDRLTDFVEAGDPVCGDGSVFWLVAPSGAGDFGTSSGGNPRDVSNPDPACP